ncbi:MAG: hypothetical protein AABY09_05360, partial [Nanoarchaeota archaeon]
RFNSIAGLMGGKYYIMDNLSGGGGTVQIEPVQKEDFDEFCEQTDRHYYKKKYSKEHEDILRSFLNERGVELRIDEYTDLRKGVLKDTISIYGILPRHHFGHRHFKELTMGGWGSGGAKCSQYEDPAVHMFNFVMNGAKRNFRGLLLHETGHAVYENLKHFDPDLDFKLQTWSRQMHQPFATDYLFGQNERFDRLKSGSDELAAETYLLYVANGRKLKEFISELSGNERKAWENLYDMHQKSFGGIEYV